MGVARMCRGIHWGKENLWLLRLTRGADNLTYGIPVASILYTKEFKSGDLLMALEIERYKSLANFWVKTGELPKGATPVTF